MMCSRGFTLIEALIALLVLSFGLLGVAAMQLKALQSAHIGYQRSLASLIAIDAQEWLWSRLNHGESGCPEPGDVEGDWLSYWSGRLPGIDGSNIAESGECEYSITVTWSEARFSADGSTTFTYLMRLPDIEALP